MTGGSFEKLCLEGFQSGLSWRTILSKRENFRAAFANFEIEQVAGFSEEDVERLLQDAGIVRHRGKIEAAISNAQRAAELVEREGSIAAFVWGYEPDSTTISPWTEPTSPPSVALSKELRKRGWKFVGPTTVYAFMQAMGLVNDHSSECAFRLSSHARTEGVRTSNSLIRHCASGDACPLRGAAHVSLERSACHAA